MNDDAERDVATPAEARLLGYLADLRADPPEADAALVPDVLRRARWQRAARPYLASFGNILSAIAEGVRVLAGGPRSR